MWRRRARWSSRGVCRFDFSHQKPMTHDEIRAVEDLVNAMILQNTEVETHLMTPEEAIAKGALALFGEKYGDEVRVVSMGVDSNERTRRPRLFHRAVRRHPCRAHRRYRPAEDRQRERGRLRRAPHRGAHGRGGAGLSRRPGRARARGGRAAQGRPRRGHPAACRGHRRAPQARASARRRQARACSWRRRRQPRRQRRCGSSARSSCSPA